MVALLPSFNRVHRGAGIRELTINESFMLICRSGASARVTTVGCRVFASSSFLVAYRNYRPSERHATGRGMAELVTHVQLHSPSYLGDTSTSAMPTICVPELS